MTKTSSIVLGRRRLNFTNLQKILYPAAGFTKGEVIKYYLGVAEFLLPHLRNRPVTLVRYPDGVGGGFFYEKNAPAFAPAWVKTLPVPRSEGGEIDFVLINDVATLGWVANLAALELHSYLHRAPKIEQPTAVVFDLDPGEGANILTCAKVALLLRDLLSQLQLESFPKVSGSKGIQIYVPFNRPLDYATSGAFAHAVADLLTLQHPTLVLSKMAKVLRKGKVFIDWSQNSDHKTTVSVYSLRAKQEQPFVSAPVEWNELQRALRVSKEEKLFFGPEAALRRLQRMGDLFEPVLTLKQKMPAEILQHLRKTGDDPPASRVRPSKRHSQPSDAGQRRPKSAGTLAEYSARRDFAQTGEPKPRTPRGSKAKGALRFVVQKHAATHLHYDFRLEMDQVLKSWAVPKGVPLKRKEIRGAFATEDHPIDYLDFEGIIPQGQYGGGTVMVWDIGTYEILDGSYGRGKLTFRLSGHKLKGEWTLVLSRKDEKKPAWLLIKSTADAKSIPEKKRDYSAITGRSLEQIAADRAAFWQSTRS